MFRLFGQTATWPQYKLQFRHRLDDSLKHRSLADLIGGPEWDLALAKSLIIRHRKRKIGSWSFI